MSSDPVVEAGVDSEESAPAPTKKPKKETPVCPAKTEAMFDPAHEHMCSLEADHYEKDSLADHYCKECGRNWYKKGAA